MKKTYPVNFSITLSRESFDGIRQTAEVNKVGLYRALKDYLILHNFTYMLKGDYIRVIFLNETFSVIKVNVHLNQRLLTKAEEMVDSVGLYAATRQRGKNPLGGTEPTAADY